jgi:hypothetical protein
MYSKGARILEDALQVLPGDPLEFIDYKDHISRIVRITAFPILGNYAKVEEDELCNFSNCLSTQALREARNRRLVVP